MPLQCAFAWVCVLLSLYANARANRFQRTRTATARQTAMGSCRCALSTRVVVMMCRRRGHRPSGTVSKCAPLAPYLTWTRAAAAASVTASAKCPAVSPQRPPMPQCVTTSVELWDGSCVTRPRCLQGQCSGPPGTWLACCSAGPVRVTVATTTSSTSTRRTRSCATTLLVWRVAPKWVRQGPNGYPC